MVDVRRLKVNMWGMRTSVMKATLTFLITRAGMMCKERFFFLTSMERYFADRETV